MTRIRYKNQNGTLVSKSYKTPNGDEVVVNIKSDFSFVVCNLKGELKGQSIETINTLNEAKKLAKQTLIAMGIVFEAEVRPRLKDQIMNPRTED